MWTLMALKVQEAAGEAWAVMAGEGKSVGGAALLRTLTLVRMI